MNKGAGVVVYIQMYVCVYLRIKGVKKLRFSLPDSHPLFLPFLAADTAIPGRRQIHCDRKHE